MRADVAERRQIERVFRELGPFDLTLHLAAEFGRNNGQEFFEDLWRSNQIGTRNVIDLCIETESRLLLAGSSEAYGESTVYVPHDSVPLAESSLDIYAPAHWNEYALSKYCQERQVFIAASTRGLRAAVLRLFNCYGYEYYTPYRSVVCLFIYRLMKGEPITVYRNYHRVFQWVGDFVKTVANAVERFDALPRVDGFVGSRPGSVPVFNVGGREYLSVEEMKDKVVALLGGTDSNITYLDKEAANVTNKRPDISLAERDLGHDPKTLLDEGLPITVDWMAKVYGT